MKIGLAFILVGNLLVGSYHVACQSESQVALFLFCGTVSSLAWEVGSEQVALVNHHQGLEMVIIIIIIIIIIINHHAMTKVTFW